MDALFSVSVDKETIFLNRMIDGDLISDQLESWKKKSQLELGCVSWADELKKHNKEDAEKLEKNVKKLIEDMLVIENELTGRSITLSNIDFNDIVFLEDSDPKAPSFFVETPEHQTVFLKGEWMNTISQSKGIGAGTCVLGSVVHPWAFQQPDSFKKTLKSVALDEDIKRLLPKRIQWAFRLEEVPENIEDYMAHYDNIVEKLPTLINNFIDQNKEKQKEAISFNQYMQSIKPDKEKDWNHYDSFLVLECVLKSHEILNRHLPMAIAQRKQEIEEAEKATKSA